MLKTIDPLLTGRLLHLLDDLARAAHVLVQTGETLPYGCYLLRKGAAQLLHPRENW